MKEEKRLARTKFPPETIFTNISGWVDDERISEVGKKKYLIDSLLRRQWVCEDDLELF